MSASSSKPPSKHTAHANPREEMESEGTDIQQKKSAAALRLPSAAQQLSDQVLNMLKRKDIRGESPWINHGREEAQKRKAGDGIDLEHSLSAEALTGINHGREEVQKRKAGDGIDLEHSLSTEALTGINHGREEVQKRKVGDGIDLEHSLSTEAQTGINHGREEAQTGKAGDGIDLEHSLPMEALTITDQTPSISMLQGASNFQLSNANFTAIGGNATIIQFGNGQFTEVQRDMIGDYIATLAALPGINDNVKKHILTQLIVNMPRAEAVFNDYQTKKKNGPCFEGTRVSLLREMADWVTSKDESGMYILSGLAGIGKSTIAYTIASRAADINLLGASFFFARDDADRNNAKKLFTTIAYQLCVYDEQFAKVIGDALRTERGSAATTKDLHEQLRVLILDPLRSLLQSHTRPILVVVDALDECDEDDVHLVIQGLHQLVQDLPSFKVILTTRPQSLFDHLLSNQGGNKSVRLQDIDDKVVDSDIRLYLKYHLSLENVKRHFPKRQWHASDEQIDLLVRAAGRLFIIAATSVRYILDRHASNPAAQMQELLRASDQDRTTLKDLNHFYTVILQNVVPAHCDNYNIIDRYQSVVGAIILVQRPLPVSVLSRLIGVDVEEIHAVLDNLQSVILLDDDEVPHVYHKSFPDYLTDTAQCKDPNLRIDPKTHHTRIATYCFEIAENHLKYNILSLGTPARFMDNEDALKNDGITDEKLLDMIPQHLRYGCVYWVAHLELANIEDNDIVNRLEKFVNMHTLHWFEVLSIIGKLDMAHQAIRTVLNIMKLTSSDLYGLLSDALRFFSKFYEIINRSALHTYYSALPFSPTDSGLYRRWIKEAAHGIGDVEGGPEKWDALVAEMNHGKSVNFIKFSLDSSLFGTCSAHEPKSSNRKLKVWDAITGTPISTIPGYTFAISNDFSTVISSNDKIITSYNRDGSAIGTMVIASSKIENLVLSSESSRVAAALSDGTLCLWDSRNSDLIDSLDGYKPSGYWHRLQFSLPGTRLIHSSANGIVKLRDGINGKFVADLQTGASHKLTLSADGSRIASLSFDHGLILWNSEHGGLISEAKDVCRSRHPGMLAISANGSLLATGDDHNVTLWRNDRGQLIDIEVLECDYTKSIAFSPDNRLAICDSSGIKIYNIETRTVSTLLPRASREPLAFSPDGTRLACGTLLCDVQAINSPAFPSRVPSVMALSRDCSRLSCMFWDGTIELWETNPTMRRIVSHQDYGLGRMGMTFGPNSRLLASWWGGTIKLWNGKDGLSLATLNVSSGSLAVALSNSILVAGGDRKVTLWDPDTLTLIHTFETFGEGAISASISDQGDLVSIIFNNNLIDLFNLENCTTASIQGATATLRYDDIQRLTFLPDKSHLVVQTPKGKFLSLNLDGNCTAQISILEHLIQLPNIPRWHGIPIYLYWASKRCYVAGLFSQDQGPLPVQWVPTDMIVRSWTQESSMIALGGQDGRIILIRVRTSHAD